jgi:hypothetical protein
VHLITNSESHSFENLWVQTEQGIRNPKGQRSRDKH